MLLKKGIVCYTMEKRKTRVYLDNCCYNRPFDDRSNIRNYLEREALLLFFEMVYAGEFLVIGSEILEKEISVMPDFIKCANVKLIYQNLVYDKLYLDSEIIKKAKMLSTEIKTKPYDSLHLAVADNEVDVFLTTDIKLMRASARTKLSFRVMNPIDFVMEVANNE